MLVSVALLVLAVWTQLLNWIAVDLLHFEVPANFLFVAAAAVGFVLLLHFSVATSRLAEETKVLAQEVARLDAELRASRTNGAGPPASAAPAEQGEDNPPIEAKPSLQEPRGSRAP
jgi:Uncharacterized conserved protein (DUF2304)